LFFNHLDGSSINPDTLFIADQSNGLLKFWFDGTKWIFGNGSASTPFGQKLVFAGGATGVIGYVVNPGPNATFQLYVTGSNVQGQNPNQIALFLDTGSYNGGFSSGNFTTLALVGAIGGSPNGNENFAGLALVPASGGGAHAGRRGQASHAGAKSVIVDLALLAEPSKSDTFGETNQVVAAPRAVTPTPIRMPAERSASAWADGASVKAFWESGQANGWRTNSLWTFDANLEELSGK
jgi:hypothetical protein